MLTYIVRYQSEVTTDLSDPGYDSAAYFRSSKGCPELSELTEQSRCLMAGWLAVAIIEPAYSRSI